MAMSFTDFHHGLLDADVHLATAMRIYREMG